MRQDRNATRSLVAETIHTCAPSLLALRAGQFWECDHGHCWITVEAIDEARGNHDWFVKWVTA